jgi:hypothetical protein
MSTRKIICLEFNELSPALMDGFIAAGHLPNFAKLRSRSQVFTTDAEEVAPYLEPWIQWVTVHTGLSFKEHGVFDLGDGHKVNVPRVWDLIGESGRKVWICGSMNASFRQPIDGYVLPDPWSTGIHPYPDGEFDAYFKFVRTNVQEHTRESMAVSRAEQLNFLTFMTSHGMGLSTVTAIARQLMSEFGGHHQWKRAAILDRLQWDVFTHYWHKHSPAFSTFFLNSTAHYQHMYWRNMDPDKFSAKPTDGEQQEYANAIRFGYEQMDVLVGKCLALADRDTTIVFASALGQQPCLKYESTGGKIFYRPNDPKALFDFAGVTGTWEYAPVMSEQFHLYFKTAAEAAEASRKLGGLKIGDRPVMLHRSEDTGVFSGCSIFEKIEPDTIITSSTGKTARFYELFYNCNLVKSGMHHPDGILWIADPAGTHQVHPEKVSLRRVAPTLATMSGLELPEYMSEPLAVSGLGPVSRQSRTEQPQPVGVGK